MPRRLINLAFNANVAALGVFAIAWAGSMVMGYTGVLAWGGRAVLLDTCRGEISLWTAPVVAQAFGDELFLDNTLYDRADALTAAEWYRSTRMNKSGLFALGLGFARANQLMPPIATNVVPSRFGYGIVLPYWLLCVLTLVWPVARTYRQHKLDVQHDRHLQGLCPKCGYDMRATPDRCPECGASGNPV